ncbi:hypothetical protein DYH09_06195 [bacterium CPR1]|nr:hypothetical protein [bacterium CPR1]
MNRFIVLLLVLLSQAAWGRVLKTDETLVIDKATGASVVFKAGTEVNLRRNGSVSAGTLASNTTLVIDKSTGKSVDFMGGTRVTFAPDGSVKSGFFNWQHSETISSSSSRKSA